MPFSQSASEAHGRSRCSEAAPPRRAGERPQATRHSVRAATAASSRTRARPAGGMPAGPVQGWSQEHDKPISKVWKLGCSMSRHSGIAVLLGHDRVEVSTRGKRGAGPHWPRRPLTGCTAAAGCPCDGYRGRSRCAHPLRGWVYRAA